MDALPRNHALDVLKLVLAVLVALFHAQALEVVSPTLASLVDRGFGRIVVPVFLIINGFFFQPLLARGSWQRWLRWLALVYAGCMLLYLPFWIVQLPGGLRGVAVFVSRWVLGFWHLWYLAGLLVAALLTVALRHQPPQRVMRLALLLFLAGVLVQYAAAYPWPGEPPLLERLLYSVHSHRNALLLSFPFFYLGVTLRAQRLHERISGPVVLALLPVSLLALLIEAEINVWFTAPGTQFDNMLFGLAAAPLLFLAVMRAPLRRGLPHLSELAIGIYLLHPLGIWTMRESGVGNALAVGVGAVGVSAAVVGVLLAASAYRSDSIRST